VQGTLVVLIADPGEGSFSASGAVLRSPAGRRYAKQSRNGGLFVHENQCCWSGGMDWQRSGPRHPDSTDLRLVSAVSRSAAGQDLCAAAFEIDAEYLECQDKPA
jgi:hypothetical protein